MQKGVHSGHFIANVPELAVNKHAGGEAVIRNCFHESSQQNRQQIAQRE